MKKILLGPDPLTTWAGIILGLLVLLQDFHAKGETDAVTISLASGIYLAGRVANIKKKKKN